MAEATINVNVNTKGVDKAKGDVKKLAKETDNASKASEKYEGVMNLLDKQTGGLISTFKGFGSQMKTVTGSTTSSIKQTKLATAVSKAYNKVIAFGKKAIASTTVALNSMTASMTAYANSTKVGRVVMTAFTAANKLLVGGLKLTRLALIGLGIPAIVLAVTSLVAAFTNGEEAQNRLRKVTMMLSSVFDNLLDFITPLGEKLISIFKNPKQAILDFVGLIKDNIINRFEGLLELVPALGSAIGELFSGNFSAAGEIAANAVAKVTLGVEDMTGKVSSAASAVGDMVSEISADAEKAAALADRMAALEREARTFEVESEKQRTKIAQLRADARNDEEFTAEQRLKFLEEAATAEQALNDQEKAMAEERLAILQEKNALGKSNREDLDEEARLAAEIERLNTKSANFERKLNIEKKTIRKEAEKNAKDAAKAEQERIDTQEALTEKQLENEITRLEKEGAAAEDVFARKEELLQMRIDHANEAEEADQLKHELEMLRLDEKNRKEEELAEKRQERFDKQFENIDNEIEKMASQGETEIAQMDMRQQLLEEQLAMAQTEEERKQAQDAIDENRREMDLAANERVTAAKEEMEQRLMVAKMATFDNAVRIAGADSKLGKALLVAKQLMLAKEMVMEATKTLTFSKNAAARSTIAIAEGTAQTAKVGFPQNIPMLIGYAAQAAGIISAIKDATKAADIDTPDIPTSGNTNAPQRSFADIASNVQQQAPQQQQQDTTIRAYIVSSDVTDSMEAENELNARRGFNVD